MTGPLRPAIPNFKPPTASKRPPVRVDMVETQASAVREAYLADRLAQIDGWAYDQRPWGPAEMPVPSSLPFGRDPRARVRARVEEVMKEVSTPQPKEVETKLEMPEVKKPTVDKPEPKERTLKDKRRWSMLSLKSAAEPDMTNFKLERGPPSAFKRWSVLKPNDEAPKSSTIVPSHTRSASETTIPPVPLKRNRRWSLQNLKEVLSGKDEPSRAIPPKLEVVTAKQVKAKEERIITHLPERISSISPTKPKKATTSTLPSPTMSMVSLDLDFDLFGLSSDSQSIKTPESANSPDPPQADQASVSPQVHAERDAWRHEALLLYDQLCYWRLEALERGRERDGWRGIALSAGVQVPPCVVKSLPPTAAPLSETQHRARDVEREREKGRDRVREWHLASIERERREHAAREAERRAMARENAERKELERRVLERRAREREMARHAERRDEMRWHGHSRQPSREYGQEPRHSQPSREWHGRHSRQQSYEWAIPSPAAEAAADAMAIVGAAPAGVLPPPGLPGHMSPVTGSWGRNSRSSQGGSYRFPPDPVPEHEHDARPRAVGWPASESGRERARELLTPPRVRQAVRSGTA
ncbi:hypothetical protein CspHIS471_0105240 [Cutaneotrichosporon sp. HIS471]|nr:hypothetical protein CspHIS471_0105240 [Cutaneotrichosporon sp. HIS471]